MTKSLLLILASLILCSCGIEYDGETKVIFEGRVTDRFGNPIAGIPVKAHYYYQSDEDLTGTDVTDADGKYLMIFPGAQKEIQAELLVNPQDISEYGVSVMSLSATSVVNITPEVYKAFDHKIVFDDVQLFDYAKAVTLNLHFENSGNTNQPVKKVNIEGLVHNGFTDFDFDYTPENYRYGFSNDFYAGHKAMQVAMNQTITVRYMFEDGTIHETEIQVAEDDINYTITY